MVAERGVRGSHLNVLVQCSASSIASSLLEMAELCARHTLVCLLPGDLHLPEHRPWPSVGRRCLDTDASAADRFLRLDGSLRDSVQVVSLTSVPLWPMVEQGRFLEGLFYRLNVVSLTAGPL